MSTSSRRQGPRARPVIVVPLSAKTRRQFALEKKAGGAKERKEKAGSTKVADIKYPHS